MKGQNPIAIVVAVMIIIFAFSFWTWLSCIMGDSDPETCNIFLWIFVTVIVVFGFLGALGIKGFK